MPGVRDWRDRGPAFEGDEGRPARPMRNASPAADSCRVRAMGLVRGRRKEKGVIWRSAWMFDLEMAVVMLVRFRMLFAGLLVLINLYFD